MRDKCQIAVIDPVEVEPRQGSAYPAALRAEVGARRRRRLTDALGMSRFGVNILELPPGSASALRHWHTDEDEFIYVLSGHPTLITENDRRVLSPGMTAGFPAGVRNGHHLVNETEEMVRILEVGSRSDEDIAFYPDHDLVCQPGRYSGSPRFTRRDGTPCEEDT